MKKDSNNLSEENFEFDFSNQEEIKNLLNKFFYSKFPANLIANFLTELINEYSEFVFFSFKCLNEIKELNVVKTSLHEKFKKYHKISMELEAEVEDLKRFSKTNKEIKDILLKQRQEIEVKYTDSLTQITYLKDESNVLFIFYNKFF